MLPGCDSTWNHKGNLLAFSSFATRHAQSVRPLSRWKRQRTNQGCAKKFMSFRRLAEEKLPRLAVTANPKILTAPDQVNLPGSPETIRMNDNVEPFLVPEAHSIRQAMERLEKTEEKIVFVVDGELRLVGSLTDGDIRRWILSDGDLNAQAARVCNRSPYVVEEGFRTEQVRMNMLQGNLGCVPVINASREIVRLLFWKEMFQGGVAIKPKRRLNLPVVIMAGGQGTRL